MIENLEYFKNIFTSGPLQKLKFYNVNDNFFEFVKKGMWLIDCGIEMTFPHGTISIAWNSDLEMLELKNDTVINIYNEDNLVQLENDNILRLNKFVGLHVKDVKFKSLEFEYFADYTMRTEKEERVVELIIEFEYNYIFQIAMVNYNLKENQAPEDFSYDINNDILISTEKIIDIKT